MENWRNLYHSAAEAGATQAIAAHFVQTLSDLFAQHENAGLGTRLNPQKDGRVLATLSTPARNGRIVLNWRLNKNLALEGLLDIEAQKFDEFDQICWERVFQIVISGRQFYMERDGARVDWVIGDINARSASDQAWVIAIHIVRSVLSGKPS